MGQREAFEKIGITIEALQQHMQQEATNPSSQQLLNHWRQLLGPKGHYGAMSAADAGLIHRWDAMKNKRGQLRATIPEIAQTLGVPVPQHFQQYMKQAGTRVETPYEQTYQRQAGSLMGTFPIKEETDSHWDEHDKRMDEKRLQGPEDTQLQV